VRSAWLLCLATTSAVAAPRVARLSFVAADGGCVDEPALRAAVSERLGRDPFRDDAAQLVHVALTQLHARIERSDADGTSRGVRELDARDCGELLELTALSIAIAIDPLWMKPAAPPVAVVHETQPVAQAASIDAWIATGVLGSVRAAPGVTAGVSLQLGARREWLAATIEARFDPPVTYSTMRMSRLFAFGAVCVVRGGRACALAGVDRIEAQGRGVDMPRSDTAAVATVGARLAWPIVVRFMRIVPHFDVFVPLARTSFELDGMVIWRAPGVHAALGAAFELDFL